MPLTRGTRVGPYEITGSLGAGGMGEVYRARDTRLDRDVAIKVLPAELSRDAAALARFDREAKAVAALSHPNILAVYDTGTQDGTAYVVTELLEGTTLREQVAEGPLGPRRAVEYALQIARGLAAAHDRGITHRDLKPENLFVTRDGHLKILDFGLAKSIDAPVQPESSATRFATDAGTVVGTAGYMAPEQVRGKAVDHRADIFAFGTVLYEMIAGRRPFAGATPADTMSAVLSAEPAALDEGQAAASPALDRIVRRCLEKQPERRFQSARDLEFAIDTLSGLRSGSGTAMPPVLAPRRRAGAVVAAIGVTALVAGAAAGYWFGGRGTRQAVPIGPTAAYTLDAGFTFPPLLSLSPDGRTIAYNSAVPSSGANGVLWLKHLDGSRVPPGFPTAIAEAPSAWSRDSRRLLVYAQGKLVAIDTVTGARETVMPLEAPPRGVAWLADGTLLLGTAEGIARADGKGGVPVTVLRADSDRLESFVYPEPFGDGTRILYAVARPNNEVEWRAGPIDGAGDRSADPVILKGVSGVTAAVPGYLFFVRGTTLFAQRFDAGRLALDGDPVSLATEVYESVSVARASLAASATGVVAFRREYFPRQILYWVDRSGRRLGEFPKREQFSNFDLSPRGDRIAVTVRQRPFSLGSKLWLLDPARGVASDVSLPDSSYSDALWSPDGARLAYRRGARIAIRPADGGAETTIIERTAYPESWSPDGRYLAIGLPFDDDYQLWTVDLGDGNTLAPLVTGATGLDEPKFSPNGRWVVYNGSEGGSQAEVYAVPFPPDGQRYQLSSQGGVQPRWRRDGQELYYLSPDGTLMSVRVPGGDVRQASPPEPLFQTGLEASPSFDQFAPAPDGQRFLLRRPEGATGDRAPIHVIVNWPGLPAPEAR